ncbi:DUF927 domain-containing protein [Methanosarcina sp.]|uniref:DUF927 domain-containing protein n=1 Tax=Methanosarcina sp. TaxID=2213 RepID=UPI002C37812A|nr:DUF927 domain-containing protein [Methanosarcina sp.]HOW13516.1 DUF927 domain-containing protein [Methanosarcina sp.]
MTNDIERDVVVEDFENANFEDVLAVDAVGNEEIEQNFTQQIKEDFSFQITGDRKLTQKIADLIGFDIKDPYMKRAPYGRQQYFGCFVPEGYVISPSGIWQIQQKSVGDELIETPVLICGVRVMATGYFTSAEGVDYTELTFAGYKPQLETLRVPTAALQGRTNYNTIVRKNNYGSLDILDDELKATLAFLRDVRQANINEGGTAFKTGEAFTHTGWADKDCKKFILGNKMLVDDYGKAVSKDVIFIDNKNIGLEEKLQPHGTLDGWIKSISPILRNNIFRFKMYYDAATIVLAHLGVSNSAFGIVGDTSIGKTFTMQCSTSMFGNPNAKGEGLIINGDISLTALNAMLTTLTDIPAPVDEITIMKDETKKALTYAIGNGSESVRGTKEGDLRSHKKIRTNVTLTGEVDITSEFANNGANVRAFSCKQKPLPDMDPNRIDEIRNGILANYGHILPLLIAKFFENRSKLQGWYNFAISRLRKTTDDTLAKRKAEYFAAAEVGGALLEEVFKDLKLPPAKPQTIIDEMWSEFVLGTPDIPLAVKALEKVYYWAISNPANFLRPDQVPLEKHQATINGFFAYPPYQKDGEYAYIDFFPSNIKQYLAQDKEFNPTQIIGWWRDHDILECTQTKKTKNGLSTTCKVAHRYEYGKPPSQKDMIRIKMSKIKEFIETEQEESENQDA